MKRLLLIALILIFSASLTGCISEQKREELLSTLEKKEYIDSSWELFDTYAVDASPVPGIARYEYYYQDKTGVYHTVGIVPYLQTDSGEETYYKIYLSDNLERIEADEESERAYYFNSNKDTVSRVARLYPKSFLFWHWYKIKVESVD